MKELTETTKAMIFAKSVLKATTRSSDERVKRQSGFGFEAAFSKCECRDEAGTIK